MGGVSGEEGGAMGLGGGSFKMVPVSKVGDPADVTPSCSLSIMGRPEKQEKNLCLSPRMADITLWRRPENCPDRLFARLGSGDMIIWGEGCFCRSHIYMIRSRLFVCAR